MTLTNQEKQERFRKKDYLKKCADKILLDRQIMGSFDWRKDFKTFRSDLEKIVDLPSGWDDEDYKHALRALQIISDELLSGNKYLLQNDIYAGRSSVCNLMVTNDPAGLVREQKKAVVQSQKLALHLLSAIDLAAGEASDNAAVVLELARNIGLSLLKERIVPKSRATVICLMLANPVLKKPEWLTSEVAKVLKEQFSVEEINKLKEKL